jgi:hypothetical protein
MEKTRFWKEGHGHYAHAHGHPPIASTRMISRRVVVRALCLLVMLGLVYHVFFVDLRKSFTNKNIESTSNAPVDKLMSPPTPKHGLGNNKTTLGKEKATLLMLVRYAALGGGP